MPTDRTIPSPTESRTWPEIAIGAALCLVAFGTLGRLVFDLPFADWIARAGIVAFASLAVSGQVLRVRILFSSAITLSLISLVVAGGVSDTLLRTIGKSLDTAAFLGAFLILLGALREAAETSPAVRDTGAFITRQPPGRRYLALHFGGHFLGTLLNFGILSLLGPMVQRGVAAVTVGDDRADFAEIRQRRQLSALLRGFSWMILWAPTTMTQALLFSLVPGIEAGRLALYGGLMALLVTALGWAEDRLRWRGLRRRPTVSQGSPAIGPMAPPTDALGRMALVCLLAIITVFGIKSLLALATVPALMLGVPCFALAWIVVQQGARGPRAALKVAAGRLGRMVGPGFVAASPEVLTLACAGYIGTLAAALIPAELVTGAVLWVDGSPVLFLATVSLLILLMSQIALSPLMAMVFLGSALAQIDVAGVSPTALGLALAAGWALALTGSPYTAATLILGRVTGIDGRKLSWRWNGVFTLLAFGAVVLCLFAVTTMP